MKLPRLFFFPALAGFVLGALLHGQERLQGAFEVRPAGGAPLLLLPGAAPSVLRDGASPVLSGALVRLRLGVDDSALLLGSNGLVLHAAGPTDFHVERFVQEPWDDVAPTYAEMETEPSRSRVVLSQNGGEIAVDCTRQASGSRLTLETPIGAVDAGRAAWALSIRYDPRSRIYEFLLKVRGGDVRFSDRSGRHFDLFAGQRLSGVGPSNAPAIEVGEIAEDESKIFRVLDERRSAAMEDVASWPAFLDQMAPLVGGESAEGAPGEGKAFLLDEGVRPITIDFVPRVPDGIPFRGRVRFPEGQESASP